MTDLRAIGPFAAMQVTAPIDSDLVSVPVEPPAAGSHTLTNHGGPTIAQPRLVNLYPPGGAWMNAAKYEQFCMELMANGYLSGLTAYGSGDGTFLGGHNIPVAFAGTISATALHSEIEDAIHAAPSIPQPDGSTLYSILLPPGVTVEWDDGSGSSCKDFCGYHTEVEGVPLIVLPATDCGSCNQGDPFVALCMVTAHEVAESVTDPTGQGWYEDSTGMENADIVAWIQMPYGPWTVQGYWTNEHGNTVGAYQAPPVKQPPPPDNPVHDRYAPLFAWLESAAFGWSAAALATIAAWEADLDSHCVLASSVAPPVVLPEPPEVPA